MADLLKRFQTSTEAETEGVWNDLGGGLEVRLARWGNTRFLRLFEELIEPYRAEVEAGTLDPELDAKVMAEVMAKTIVLDWRGVEIDGEPVPYSVEKAQELLSRPDLRDFRANLQKRAQRAERYRAAALRSDAGN